MPVCDTRALLLDLIMAALEPGLNSLILYKNQINDPFALQPPIWLRCYVHNIFTTNYRWLIIIGSNLNLTLKLFLYSIITTNNNLLLKIYCKNIMDIFFLFFIIIIIIIWTEIVRCENTVGRVQPWHCTTTAFINPK